MYGHLLELDQIKHFLIKEIISWSKESSCFFHISSRLVLLIIFALSILGIITFLLLTVGEHSISATKLQSFFVHDSNIYLLGGTFAVKTLLLFHFMQLSDTFPFCGSPTLILSSLLVVLLKSYLPGETFAIRVSLVTFVVQPFDLVVTGDSSKLLGIIDSALDMLSIISLLDAFCLSFLRDISLATSFTNVTDRLCFLSELVVTSSLGMAPAYWHVAAISAFLQIMIF